MKDEKSVVVAEVCLVSPLEYVRVREALTSSQARVKELEEALARWGIVRWAEKDINDEDTGRWLHRCRECGRRVFVHPNPVRHRLDCSIGHALKGYMLVSNGATRTE
jgi:hypothetical protein